MAAWIFAPLLGFWYAVFAYVVRLPPGSLGIQGRPQEELLIAATVAALVSDWLIMRRVKRAMKARQANAAKR
jgi:hypothetical protein